MHLTHLVLLTVLSWAGPAPDELVSKLGSPRFSEREAAAEALRDLGREALPVLRQSRQATDLEIRTRVRALIEEIETNLMVQPTQVRLNYQDQPIGEVARHLGEQANVSINVIDNNLGLRSQQKITLVESEPVPFWKALDELCRQGNLQLNHGVQIVGVGPANRLPVLNLFPTTMTAPPSSISGPFRVSVLSLVDHKERNFNSMIQSGPIVIQNGQRVEPDTRPGVTTENFSMSLSVMSEPRMSVAIDGPVKVSQAFDDRGNDLAQPDANGRVQHASSGYNGMAHVNGSMNLTLPVGLKMPEKPGSKIDRFKATIPVVVMARKDDPLVVPLDDASKGKTFENEQIRIQVHGVQQQAGQPLVEIDLTVKLLQPDNHGPQTGAFAQEYMTFRQNQGNSQNQIEIVDAQGRPYHQWFPSHPTQPGQDGMRMNLRVMSTEGVGPPAQIRYYDLSRTATEIEVELRDIPLF